MGVLDGRVVLVTGGGRGIGRECALLAAREGAKVLVNDFGGSLSGGEEAAPNPAEDVAAEIRAAGGEALADGGSVADRAAVDAMVARAIDELGGLHAVINPAGILRDAMLHKMSEDAWQAVLDVHLRGAFNVARAAVGQFRAQKDGAFVFFGSTSALIGNLGQANYAAAKMGVVGLSRILAMEGASANVRANVLAPLAFTRMVASVPVTDAASAERVERMKTGMRADQVAPMAVALCAPAAATTGQIFVVRGNEVVLFSQPRPLRSVARLEGWSAQALIDQALPSMRASFVDLGPSASVFPYDAI